ncbi:magnesium and cobalt transport protein CorA [Actinosynnema sp. NPDC047251]|uniref:Magnesium and cobalt transport protein, CorA family n=1 Tax=Saccharothrix espanaensis (strain ATCC 51144 / DSM 44229 / JCM 9112 / NBRC 15066 / NRRL 15764) TaxID=1179773 RepID=K0K7N2_SACES|nr:magnesium and cobalt transport protein CorA [Saccharothrix espanaensis]CCH32608.1 Magnesium and cobalt transport protein, CorA family [Saccharothrix espanaensis DSM 44229]
MAKLGADSTLGPVVGRSHDSVVACGVYVDGVRLPGQWSAADAVAEVRDRGEGFVWIGLYEPADEQIRDVAEAFGLHEPAVKDAVCAHQRPKLKHYGDNLFMVFKTLGYVENESPTTANEIVESGEIMLFLGADYVVTVRHGRHAGLRDVRQQLEAIPDRLAAGPAVVLHDIADRVVDGYLEVVEAFQGDIDLVEAAVFAPRSVLGVEQMYLVKRELVELGRAVMPLAGPLRRLSDGTCGSLVPDSVRSYFRDVDDHLTSVAERVAAFDHQLSSLVDAAMAKVLLQQNNDMRKISAWVAIIAVPTMVVGVYGMNFDHMPELRWKYGYPLVLSLTFIACLTVYRLFKRNRWL